MDSIVSAIVSLLSERGGYALLASPLKIGDMTFRFDAALHGSESYGDIVLVSSVSGDVDAVFTRRIVAFTTLLDRRNAAKSVTLILVVRGSIPPTIEVLQETCRVILITPSTSLEAALRPLLRLVLPVADKEIDSTDRLLRQELEPLDEDPLVLALLAAAQKSQEDVQAVLAKEFESAVQFLLPSEEQ
jgi:hypothetical protein